VVYASSATVYGDKPDILFEDLPAKPLSAHGADKYGCEIHGFVANHIHGVSNCGLRFFNVYGPRQDPRSPYSGLITIFSTRLAAGQPITINGDGYHSRDFIYVGDVVRAILAAMDRCSSRRDQPVAEVFNVCTGVETNIIDLANELALILRAKPTINFGPPRPGDPRRLVGCPDKALAALNFRAQTNLAGGLEKTIPQREQALTRRYPATARLG
jgi:UDP-glucose 4-epimerase